jgi:hypothetical protein
MFTTDVKEAISRQRDLIIYVCMSAWGVQTLFRPAYYIYKIPHIEALMLPLEWTNIPAHILAFSSLALGVFGILSTLMRYSSARRLFAIAATGFWSYSVAGTVVTDPYSPSLILYTVALALSFPTALGHSIGDE